MPGSRKTSLIAPAMAPKRVEARESPPAPGLAPQAEHLVAMGEFHYAAAAGSPLQRRATNAAAGPDSAGPSTAAGPANRNAPANRTGLPDRLKAGIESLSGYSLDKVKVSYNSSRPAQLMAHAYARGHEIHIAPGKQAHLPHEAWHLVQQAQGRVANTTQAAGLPVNDDDALEREADVMGRKAAGLSPDRAAGTPATLAPLPAAASPAAAGPAQLGKFNDEERKRLFEKLARSRVRNKFKKARPKGRRRIIKKQAKFNYGYKEADLARLLGGDPDAGQALIPYNPQLNPDINPAYSQIDLGDTRGYYRRGFGGQPFLYLDSSAYSDKQIPSNYDDVIAHFKGQDAEVAFDILSAIESGETSGKDRQSQARSLFLLLTQFIEPHSTRVPGADKLARALLRRIALGQLTFQQAFNRKNGLFVSAWATKGGAPKGGQVAGRALFGFSKDADRYDLESLEDYLGDSLVDELLETVDGYYSDESDTEDDGDDFVDPGADVGTDPRNVSLERINAALETLGLSARVHNRDQVVLLPSLWKLIKEESHKLLLLHHPDKGGTQDAFDQIWNARQLLLDVIAEFAKKGFIDINQRNLDIHLNDEGLAPQPVAGDGNCFYAAVLDQIHYLDGIAADPAVLRQRVAQLILDNAAYFQVFTTGEQLNRIVDDILTSRSWRNIGGDFAPQLIATVLQRPVRIIQPSGPLVIDPIGGLNLDGTNTFVTGNRRINLAYDGQTHYDSTRNTRQQLQDG
ncbi:eCIS core domain-containing protein [Burkholderia gladioli]|uniref:eCIS core domain-containing protein n=1 Tax=Burkholderia gladioli TaxID=28095 RepID=UPI00163FBFF6|nr:DUF4157 domain-containing protein [Burkholderia gladioli]